MAFGVVVIGDATPGGVTLDVRVVIGGATPGGVTLEDRVVIC